MYKDVTGKVHFCCYVLHFPPPGLPGACSGLLEGSGGAPGVTFRATTCLQCENSTSFELQTTLFGSISSSFAAFFKNRLEDFNPLLQFRTRACPMRGPLPLESSFSTRALGPRRFLTLLPWQTHLSAFRHEAPAARELRARRVNGVTGRARKLSLA